MVKIVICGAGIAGLSTYLLLEKHLNEVPSSPPHEIKIYEAYDIGKPSGKGGDPTTTNRSNNDTSLAISQDQPVPTAQTLGSGIGISKNGLNVLSRMEKQQPSPTQDANGRIEADRTGLNSSLIREMARRGHPIERWEINTARGWKIVDVNLIPRPLRGPDGAASSPVQSAAAKTKTPYMYHSVMIARKACWEILRDRVLAHSPDAVVKKRIVGVVIGDATTPSTLQFEDGTEDTADLVIGADGLRSIVRKAMFENSNDKTVEVTDADLHKSDQQSGSWIQTALRWLGVSRRSNENQKSKVPDYITPHYE